MNRRVTPPKQVTSPTWGPPPPCKQAFQSKNKYSPKKHSTFLATMRRVLTFFFCIGDMTRIEKGFRITTRGRTRTVWILNSLPYHHTTTATRQNFDKKLST